MKEIRLLQNSASFEHPKAPPPQSGTKELEINLELKPKRIIFFPLPHCDGEGKPESRHVFSGAQSLSHRRDVGVHQCHSKMLILKNGLPYCHISQPATLYNIRGNGMEC